MSSVRKIIRAFLASPGDLVEERRAIRNVVNEFNDLWADELGYQVELIGWEETVSGYGRPQQIINQELDLCDLFIGMIYKRWGTPPDLEGCYTSGFEEEFERTLLRRERDGIPDISLFFKVIPEEFTLDPGSDLKKVLEFREKITCSKKILYQNFENQTQLESYIRKCIRNFIINKRSKDDSNKIEEPQAKSIEVDSENKVYANGTAETAPISPEGLNFIENLIITIKKSSSLVNIRACEIARLRLITNSISKPGNSEMILGAHDINILFAANIEGLKLSQREYRWLARLSFQLLQDENVPIWRWIALTSETGNSIAVTSSFVGVNDEEKVGAIFLLTLLGRELSNEEKYISRDNLFVSWFSEESSSKLRNAALIYLSQNGNLKDFEFAQNEYSRNDYSTLRNALQCMVEILIRAGELVRVQNLIIDLQFDSLNTYLLRSVLETFNQIETQKLLLALTHRNANVRLQAFKILNSRSKIDLSLAEKLSVDSDVRMRILAVKLLTDLGSDFTEEEIKAIVISPQKSSSKGLSGLSSVVNSDIDAEELFEQYKLDKLKKFSRDVLESKVKSALILDDSGYIALVEKYFNLESEQLRKNIDDCFESYYEERIKRLVAAYGDIPTTHELIKRFKSIEVASRKALTRKGLDILCKAKKVEDLHRIRINLQNGFTGANSNDAEFMRKHGEWIDIPLLAKSHQTQSSYGLGAELFTTEVANTILCIGKKYKLSDIFSLELSKSLLQKIIEQYPESRFSNLSHDILIKIFSHTSDNVRKAAAIMVVRTHSLKSIKSLMNKYLNNDKYRYYNVIHWLDLGASMRKEEVKTILNNLERIQRYQ